MALNVGQGILAAMTAAGDHPIADSVYSKNADGSDVERGYGLKGVYIASNASGQWENAGPLPVAS